VTGDRRVDDRLLPSGLHRFVPAPVHTRLWDRLANLSLPNGRQCSMAPQAQIIGACTRVPQPPFPPCGPHARAAGIRRYQLLTPISVDTVPLSPLDTQIGLPDDRG
jgi:hypothetical protein